MLRNKVILVTGGSSGLGFAVARELALQGGELIITGSRQDQIEDAVAKLGFYAVGVVADVSKVTDIERLFKRIEITHGRVDVVVVMPDACKPVPLGEITESMFDRIINFNVKGVTFTVQAALPLMGDGGSIVIIGDTAAAESLDRMSLIHAARAAVQSLVRGWINDIGSSGIRVNLLSTNSVDIASLQNATQIGATDGPHSAGRGSKKSCKLQSEILQATAFLASDKSSDMNGLELFAGNTKFQH